MSSKKLYKGLNYLSKVGNDMANIETNHVWLSEGNPIYGRLDKLRQVIKTQQLGLMHVTFSSGGWLMLTNHD
jgi:hypothetical protein